MNERERPIEVGDAFEDDYGRLRVIAIADGYLMIRRPQAQPFVICHKTFLDKCRWRVVSKVGEQPSGQEERNVEK